MATMTNYGAQYQVKFDMYIEAWISEVSSVLHIGNTDQTRMPAVFLHPGTKQLQININNINKHIQGNMELGRWYAIEISKTSSANNVKYLELYRNSSYFLQSVRYEVKIDGSLVKEWSLTESPPADLPVNVYLSSPWRQPMNGSVRNLQISNSPVPVEAGRSTSFNYLIIQ